MNNIRINYRYRDGANYSHCSHLVLAGGNGVDLVALSERLHAACMVDGQFVASQVQVPEVFPWLKPDAALDETIDHCYHELNEVEATHEAPSDPRTLSGFIAAFEQIGRDGWKAFDPAERVG